MSTRIVRRAAVLLLLLTLVVANISLAEFSLSHAASSPNCTNVEVAKPGTACPKTASDNGIDMFSLVVDDIKSAYSTVTASVQSFTHHWNEFNDFINRAVAATPTS